MDLQLDCVTVLYTTVREQRNNLLCLFTFFNWLFVSDLSINVYILHSIIAEIWDALRAAAEADISLAQAIVDSAGVIVQNTDLTVCYDERGQNSNLFRLPRDCLFFMFLTSTVLTLQVLSMNYLSMF